MIVTPTAGLYGGTERVLETLLESVTPDDPVAFAFLEDGPLVELAKSRRLTFCLTPRGRLRNPIATFTTVRKLRKYAREIGATRLFAWTEFSQFYAGLAAFGRYPSYWWQRGHVDRLRTRLLKTLPYRLAFGNSHFTIDRLKSMGVRCAPDPLYPVMNWARFTTAPETKSEARIKLGLPKERCIVGSVGRLQSWKGFHTFVSAVAEVRRSRPNVLGMIVGGRHDLEPDYENSLQAHIAQLEMQEHVVLTGAQNNVSTWMSAMDVFVHASHEEPFGVVILEALALGLPTIASAPGGPVDMIADGVNGILVRSGNTYELSSAIVAILEDATLRQKLEASARQIPEVFATGKFANTLAQKVIAAEENTAPPL